MGSIGSLRDTRGRASIKRREKAALALVGSAIVMLGSCSFSPGQDTPEQLVQRFASSLHDKDVHAAADMTTYPAAAQATIDQVFQGLHPTQVSYRLNQFVRLDSDSGFFSLAADWDFGTDKHWAYTVQGSVRKLAVGWRVQWDPAVLVPGLTADSRINYVRTDAPAPHVFDLAGHELMSEQTVATVRLDPAQVSPASAKQMAKAIAPVAPLVTADSISADLAAANGKPVDVVSLREGDFAILEPALRKVPGNVISKEHKLISADQRIVSPMLDSYRAMWQATRDKTAGWAIELTNPRTSSQTRVTGFQGPGGADLYTTLDPKLQLAAEDAVAMSATPAVIVAIAPSTGAVLTVAQNSQANALGPIAFQGNLAVGSGTAMFTQATAADRKVPADQVSPTDMAALARSLGLDSNWTPPGTTQPVGGSVDANGGLTASPFSMALVSAAIARGAASPPVIERGDDSAAANSTAIAPEAVASLRTAMRTGINAPESAGARGYGISGVSAASGDDEWFVGNRGDVAFAVWVQDADGGDQASKIAGRMFRSLAKPAL